MPIAYTSAVAGNWSVPTNWTPNGVPGDGDTVTLSKVMNIDQNVTIGASNGNYVSGTNPAAIQLNVGGRITFSRNVKLTIRGDVAVNTGYSNIVWGFDGPDGVTIEFDASQTANPMSVNYGIINLATSNQPGCSIRLVGTAENPCFIQSNPNGGNAWFNPQSFNNGLGGMYASYTKFTRLGDASRRAWVVGFNGAVNFELHHCTFDTCGRITTMSAATASNTFLLDNVVFKNSLDANYNLDSTVGQDYGQFRNCVFDRKIFGRIPNVVFDTCFFGTNPGYTVSASKWASFNNCFVVKQNQDTLTCGGDVTNTVFLTDNNQGNAHFWGLNPNYGHTWDRLFCEYTDFDDQGDAFGFSNVFAAAATYFLKNSFVLPNSNGDCSATALTLQGPNAGQGFVDMQHNTYIAGAQGATFNEASSVPPGTLKNFRNNLVWDTSVRGFLLIDVGHLTSGSGITTDVVAPANADYNGKWNVYDNSLTRYPSTGGWFTNQGNSYCGSFSATPGAHDITADPQFKDPTRQSVLFDTRYLGVVAPSTWDSHADGDSFTVGQVVSHQVSGYYGNAVINYRCIQGHTKGTAGTEPGVYSTGWRSYWEFNVYEVVRQALAAGTTYSDSILLVPETGAALSNADPITTLRAWLTDGYRPTNPVYKDAGSDGITIGAAPFFDAGGGGSKNFGSVLLLGVG